jgi:hypothetical protein
MGGQEVRGKGGEAPRALPCESFGCKPNISVSRVVIAELQFIFALS